MYLPKNPVAYPTSCSRVTPVSVSSNRLNPPTGGPLPYTPVVCERRPVSVLQREGTHTGLELWPLRNRTPGTPLSERSFIRSQRISSAITSTKLVIVIPFPIQH